MPARGGSSPSSRRTYLTGLGGQSQKRLGLPVYRSPIIKTRKTPTRAQLYAQQTLAVAAAMTRDLSAWEREQCKIIAGNSGFTWKDQFYAMLFGTGIEVSDVNGVLWLPRRELAMDIQQLLDSISSEPGSILVRTSTGWAVLFPGDPGDALVIDPATGMPAWEPQPTVSGSNALATANGNGTYSNNPGGNATLGIVVIPSLDFFYEELIVALEPSVTGNSYSALIANIDSTNKLLSVFALSPDTYTASATGPQTATFTFPSSPKLAKGSKYAICIVLTNKTTTTSTQAGIMATSTAFPIPGLPQDYEAVKAAFGAIFHAGLWNNTSTAPVNVAQTAGNVNQPLFTHKLTI